MRSDFLFLLTFVGAVSSLSTPLSGSYELSNRFLRLQLSTLAPRLISLNGDSTGQGKWSSANVLVNGGLALELEDAGMCKLLDSVFPMCSLYILVAVAPHRFFCSRKRL